MVITAAVVSVPFGLLLAGVDFSATSAAFPVARAAELSQAQLTDAMHEALRGSFVHTLLEWTAFSTAVLTALFAGIHFAIRKDATTPIIGAALFFSGCMDAFHTLAADRLISAAAPNANLIPFTWAICRMFNALIIMTGVGLLLWRGSELLKGNSRFIAGTAVSFGFAAYLIIAYCAQSSELPQTMYPDALIRRPFDVIPLLLFLLLAFVVMPAYHRQYPNLFSKSVMIAMVPEVATEIHMAFGSATLFDAHFNIAHFLKIIAYVIPLVGIGLEYIQVYRNEELSVELLARRNAELMRSNSDLDDFAYISSHDLKEPLRGIHNFSHFVLEDCGDQVDAEGRRKLETIANLAQRMEVLLDSLLYYSRVGRSELNRVLTDFGDVVDQGLEPLRSRIEESNVELEIDPLLPSVDCDAVRAAQIVTNLVSNAIKYNESDPIKISIGFERRGTYTVFHVRDNGIGIRKKHIDSIFRIFRRLHSQEKYGGGAGAGLTIARKIAERHGGQLWVESEYGSGTTFLFTLSPKEE